MRKHGSPTALASIRVSACGIEYGRRRGLMNVVSQTSNCVGGALLPGREHVDAGHGLTIMRCDRAVPIMRRQ
jgi:hypothetical protein